MLPRKVLLLLLVEVTLLLLLSNGVLKVKSLIFLLVAVPLLNFLRVKSFLVLLLFPARTK
jgi:hypothetical protein